MLMFYLCSWVRGQVRGFRDVHTMATSKHRSFSLSKPLNVT